jgi:hypothetical protein
MNPLEDPNIQHIRSQLDDTGNPRLLFIVPESAGDVFLSTSLLNNLKETYHEYDIYFACKPEFKDILKNNPHIYKILDYHIYMIHQILMEGTGEWPGLFDISIHATCLTQIHTNYLNNSHSRIAIKIKKES